MDSTVVDAIIILVSEQSDRPATLDSTLESLDLDSLDYVSLNQSIEEHFKIGPIPDSDLFKLATVEQIVVYVESWKQKQAEAEMARTKVSGGVLIWVLALICFVPALANGKVFAGPDFYASDRTIHDAVVSDVNLFERVPVMNLAVAVDGHAAVTQTLNLHLGQRCLNPQCLDFRDGRSQNGPESPWRWRHYGQFRGEGKLPNLHVSPMNNIVSWGLPSVLDRYLGDGASQRLYDFGNGLLLLAKLRERIGDVGNNASFDNHVRPKLPFGTLAHRYQSPPTDPNCRERDSNQRPVRNQRFSKPLPIRLFQLVTGTALLWGGILLGLNRRLSAWGWSLLSAILMALGFGLLLGNRQSQQDLGDQCRPDVKLFIELSADMSPETPILMTKDSIGVYDGQS